MQGLKKREVNSKEIEEQYQEMKRKMIDVQKVIEKAFDELKRKAEGDMEGSNESEELKKSQRLKKSTL